MRTSVDVHNFLLERDTPHEVFLARGRLRSADRIAAVLDLRPGEVGRVVMFETIVIVFLIGRLFAIAWFDALSARNPLAFGMVAQFVVMLFYFPANNQTSQFGEGFTAFWAILIAWLLTRNGLIRIHLRQTEPQQDANPSLQGSRT